MFYCLLNKQKEPRERLITFMNLIFWSDKNSWLRFEHRNSSQIDPLGHEISVAESEY